MNHENEITGANRIRKSTLFHLPLVDFESGWRLQHVCVAERIAGLRKDTLILTEHPPTFTLGRTAKKEHWSRVKGLFGAHKHAVYQIERGGSVTYHGPGQIVGYPILRLRDFCPGPKGFVRLLEEVLIRVLARWSIKGERVEKFPGVWVKNKAGTQWHKIAAIGVRIINGVTMHGFALNVNVNLEPFGLIVPCGIAQCQVTTMTRILEREIDLWKVGGHIADHFAQVFNLDWQEKEAEIPFDLKQKLSHVQIPHPPLT